MKWFGFICLVFMVSLNACSSAGKKVPRAAPEDVDFSGAWELDYSQSDNIQARFDTMMRELRRQAERRAQGGVKQSGVISSGGGAGLNGESILGLAQMAELITRSQLLDIKHDEHTVQVKREDNFALDCEFYPGKLHSVETPLGSEICGWDDHQLVFRILLPEGLSIQHRLTLGPQGERLNIATTVFSSQVSYPFTLNRVYNRYDPDSGGIRCKQTISRGRVCTTEAPQ